MSLRKLLQGVQEYVGAPMASRTALRGSERSGVEPCSTCGHTASGCTSASNIDRAAEVLLFLAVGAVNAQEALGGMGGDRWQSLSVVS